MIRSTIMRSLSLVALVVLSVQPARADRETQYRYDNAGQVTHEYVYDSAAPSSVLMETERQYDSLGRQWDERESAAADSTAGNGTTDDRRVVTAYDVSGNVAEESRPTPGDANVDDAVTTYTYDFANRRTSMTDALMHTTTYAYDRRGDMTLMTDPLSNVTHYEYDARGLRTKETRDDAASMTSGILVVETTYDSRDRKIKEVSKDSGGNPLKQERWGYDRLSRLNLEIRMADPADTGDSDKGVDRFVEYTGYEGASHRLLARTSFLTNSVSRQVSYAYDAAGRKTQMSSEGLVVETYSNFDDFGNFQTKTIADTGDGSAPNPRTFDYAYDSLGRMTTMTEDFPAGDFVIDYGYDVLDRRTSMTDALGVVTSYEYNDFGEQIVKVEDDGFLARETQTGYNQLGFERSHTTWDGPQGGGGVQQTTLYDTDELGRRLSIEFCDDSGSPTWEYAYDAAGRMTQRTDGKSTVTNYEHNWRGQVIEKTVSGTSIAETFGYDAIGRMTSAQWTDGTTTFQTAMAYADGTPDAAVIDEPTSVTQTIGGVSKTFAYSYDVYGDLTSITYPSATGDVNAVLEFDYDKIGQVTQIDRSIDGGSAIMLAEYDYAGRHVTERRVTTMSDKVISAVFDYDQARRQTNVENLVGAGSLDDYAFEFDDVGNRTQTEIDLPATSNDDTITYDYDGLHRLTQASYATSSTDEEFHYDLLGNRESYDHRDGNSITYDDNCANEYIDITPGTADPNYNDAGNLVRTENDYELVYDYEQRLIEVKDPADATILKFSYDAMGHRVLREEPGGKITRYYYDGENVAAEYDDSNVLLRWYVHGPTFVDERLLVREPRTSSDAEFYYLLGALYSTTGIVDAGGAPVVRYLYDAYGLPTLHDAAKPKDLDGDGDVDLTEFAIFSLCFGGSNLPPAASCPEGIDVDFDDDGDVDLSDFSDFSLCFGGPATPPPAGDGCVAINEQPYYFTGRRLDLNLRDQFDPNDRPELALYHYRARAYDPFHGRFLQQDPMLYVDSYSLYQFVMSNPQLYKDPTGKFGYLDLLTGSGLSVAFDANTIDQGETITHSILGLTGLFSLRNRMHDDLLGTISDPGDLDGVILASGILAAYRVTQDLFFAYGALRAGAAFSKQGIWAFFDLRTSGKRGIAARARAAHHGIAKFLGGHKRQLLYEAPDLLHHEFEQRLLRNLKDAGFPDSNIGTGRYLRYLRRNTGSQDEAFRIVQRTASAFDDEYGTHFLTAFWANFFNGFYKQF